jgi:hypothetical protein
VALLGRDRLLAWGVSAWRDAVAGHGRVLLLAGEAGIGKTTLARAIVDHAAADGAVVRWGSCWDGGRVPLSVWIEALRATDDDPCAKVAARVVERTLADDADAAAAENARLRLLSDVVDAVRAASKAQPQLVVLDDVHWADSASLLLLRALAAHAPTMRVLVVATYRDDEVPADSPLLGLGGGADYLELHGLTEPDVGRLLGDVLGRTPTPAEQRGVYQQTAGNPLFVSHVARLLDGGAPSSLPHGMGEVLARRLARLPAACDRALGAAAVLGHEFDVDTVARVLDASADDTLAALDHAIAARVAGPVEGSVRRWAFTHALVRTARDDALASTERAELHRRAFDALAGAGATPVAVLAHHAMRGRFARDDLRPVEAMLAAGDDALRRLAPDEAMSWYQHAVALAPAGLHGDEPRARAHLGLGRARMRSGDGTGAGDAFVACAALARRLGRPELLALAALGFGSGLGGFEIRMLDRRQAELLEEAAAALDERSPLRPWVLARLSCALTMLGTPERRLALADDAITAARALGDRAAIAAALAGRCDAIAGPAFVAERVAASDEIIAIGEQLPDLGIELLGRRHRIVTLAERCDLRELDAEVARFERTASLLADPIYSWYVPLWHASRALSAGRLDEATRLAEEARRIGTLGGSANAQVLPLVVDLYVSIVAEDGDALRRNIELLVGDLAAMLLANGMPMLLWGDVMLGAADGAIRTRDLVERVDDVLAVDAEWLAAMVPLVDLVFMFRLDDLAPALYERLVPFHAVGVVEGIVATHRGATARWLALLAAQMGDAGAVEAHIAESIALAERVGPLVLHDAHVAAAAARARVGVTTVVEGHPERAEATPASMHRAGDAWTITWEGRAVQVRHAKGIADLATLLERPGREVHVRELDGAALPGHTGGSDAALDATALAQYRHRLFELEAELDEADRHADVARAAGLAAERDAVVDELTRAVGLGGRSRPMASDPDERLRKAVSARVKASIDRVELLHPPLGRHLRASVHTGFWCRYAPERDVHWDIRRHTASGE